MSGFTVFGAGAMGTAMSYLLAHNSYDVLMWARRKEIAEQINKKRENAEYMPTLILPENVRATTSLDECATTARRIIVAVPSHSVNELFTRLNKHVPSNAYWLSVVKGMDTKDLLDIITKINKEIRSDMQIQNEGGAEEGELNDLQKRRNYLAKIQADGVRDIENDSNIIQFPKKAISS